MLDLNFSISQTQQSDSNNRIMEDSETSNSSIVNGEEATINGRDESSSVLIFDILKKEKEPEKQAPFPVAGNYGGWDSGHRRPQWLNLSSADSGDRTPEQRALQPPVRKSRRGPRSRSSQYRGVTFYRRTGRWESHIWDCGKQVYLGGFDTAHAAARAYDRAALKFRGVDADINFNRSDYDDDMQKVKNLSKEEFVQVLRRQSAGFSRGGSKLRGLSLHKFGRWETQILAGKNKLHDEEAIRNSSREAVIANFEPRSYKGETMLDANYAGNGHNLDLSLGISVTSTTMERPKNGWGCVGGQRPHILPKQSPPSIWSGLFLPNNEENKGREKRIEVGSMRWQMQPHNNYSAASSGFSSSTSPPLLSLYDPQNNTSLYTLCFPTPYSSNSSHFS